MTLRIKNMVCPRCIMMVEQVLQQLDLQPQQVRLGEAEILPGELNIAQKQKLLNRLQELGFNLLEDPATVMTEQIKNLVISQLHYASNEPQSINWSQLLSQQLHRDYSYLSKLFSKTEGLTIEQYILLQKTEKIKSLLQNGEQSLSQIAADMQYSSVAHLSAQFKKITRLTPSQYRQQAQPQRYSLDATRESAIGNNDREWSMVSGE